MGVKALADTEHSLWRRDASFGTWREVQMRGPGLAVQDGDPRLPPLADECPDDDLKVVEEKLLLLRSRIQDKVDAVAATSAGGEETFDDSASQWIGGTPAGIRNALEESFEL